MGKLTALKAKGAGPGRHGDGEGLYLLVSVKGAKSWVLRVVVHGKRRDIGLGPYSLYSLSEARNRARDLRKVAKEGGDPLAHRDKERVRIPSFRDAAVECHEAKSGGWSDKSAKAFLSSLELHVFPKIGDRLVDGIDAGDVAMVLIPTWTEKPTVAVKLRHRIGLVLDFAKAKRWRSEPTPRETLNALLPKRPKGGEFASMPYADLPDYVSRLQGEPESVGRLALLFTIFTAARSGEVREALWSHFDLEAAEWRRPAELMRKTGQAHTIVLNRPALEVLDRMARLRTEEADCVVFPGVGGRKLSDMTLSKIARPTGFTVHGFRATFKTWAVERMPGIPEPVSEAALAHLVPDKVERAYNRAKFLDMRRTLLDAWGRYVSNEESAVVHLPSKAG